ncbi:metal transporter cnnm2 [Lasius niger]|uniref:Metal transporter cnnm2 n=1 Tax=Lasius niger TaxID=67767 RepID=A0A0J7K4G7_LASNI|nr:metal transporter cnnm2 [Lasius niger]
MKLSAEYSDRMMAQHVGRSRFTPATVLLLLVPACVAQLANANATTTSSSTTTTTTIDGVRYDDTSSRVVVQPTVKSAPVIRTAVALSHGAADDRRPLVEFLGTGLGRDLALRWSPSRHDCPMTYSDDTHLDAVWTSPTRDRAIYEFRTSITEDPTIAVVYFCLRNGSDDDDGGDGRRWSNLGDRVSIEFPVRPE